MESIFRPSARLLSTIGEDIIKDIHAAIVELVKNSYDADAKNVSILFSSFDDGIQIEVMDDGHGMTENIVRQKWLVPSTSDKLVRKRSPNGRLMQGRKGIGRFAASILGEKLELRTVVDGQMVILEVNWDDFSSDKFLDEVKVVIKRQEIEKLNGTEFQIFGSKKKKDLWTKAELESLIKELRKLITPLNDGDYSQENDEFRIEVIFNDFFISEYSNSRIEIKPYPLLDYYDYRLFGSVGQNGDFCLYYQSRNNDNLELLDSSDIDFNLADGEKFSGRIMVDFRVFDRDPESIEELVNSLVTNGNNNFKKNEAKRMLDDISGVSIFRNKFRIRPYGDLSNDWLLLDSRRVQNPSLKVGANQLSGQVIIESEEVSNLVEKSARDGLKEDAYYNGLVSIVLKLISYIERRRYSSRKSSGRGRKNSVISGKFDKLLDFSFIQEKLDNFLNTDEISEESYKELALAIESDNQVKIKIVNEIEQMIAMYHGQATLGKIMGVLMHETRKPIGWLKDQVKVLDYRYNKYLQNNSQDDFKCVMDIIESAPIHLKVISDMFEKLDPFSPRSRKGRKSFKISSEVKISLDLYRVELEQNSIRLELNLDDSLTIFGWKEDIRIAIVNIIDNAIYWLSKNKIERVLKIDTKLEDEVKIIRIYNNGPSIPPHMLANDLIFEPGISLKENNGVTGTGIGLALAGEAVARNLGKLTAQNQDNGVQFTILFEPTEGGKNEERH